MKKLLLITSIIFCIVAFPVNALQYDYVGVETTFDSDIEFSDVPKIYLYVYAEGVDNVDDNASISKTIELSQTNNYSYSIENVYIPDISHLFAIVEGDNRGVYDCSITLKDTEESKGNLQIYVKKNNLPRDETVSIPTNIVKQVFGNKNSSNTNTSNEGNQVGPNDEGEIVIGQKPTTTTKPTQSDIDPSFEEKEKKEQEKLEKEQKKNNIIGIIMFSIIGIIVLIGGIIIYVKCVNANK